jgi:hypothetical protein
MPHAASFSQRLPGGLQPTAGPLPHGPPPRSFSSTIPKTKDRLYTSSDDQDRDANVLSDYQIVLRNSFELFAARQEDVDTLALNRRSVRDAA